MKSDSAVRFASSQNALATALYSRASASMRRTSSRCPTVEAPAQSRNAAAALVASSSETFKDGAFSAARSLSCSLGRTATAGSLDRGGSLTSCAKQVVVIKPTIITR